MSSFEQFINNEKTVNEERSYWAKRLEKCQVIATTQQAQVLFALRNGAMYVGEAVAKTSILGPSASRILARLKREELVEYEMCRGDRRAFVLKLTRQGRAELRRMGVL